MHNAKFLADIMKELAAADSARLMKDAAAPGVAKAVGKLRSLIDNNSNTCTQGNNYGDLSIKWSGGSPNFDK